MPGNCGMSSFSSGKELQLLPACSSYNGWALCCIFEFYCIMTGANDIFSVHDRDMVCDAVGEMMDEMILILASFGLVIRLFMMVVIYRRDEDGEDPDEDSH
jgi:hypothetical protein